MTLRVTAATSVLCLALAVPLGLSSAPGAEADPVPRPDAAGRVEPGQYGYLDAGGFRNVLPPGENGLVNALDLATFQLTGAYPDHFYDQQELYNGLIKAAPTLTDDQVGDYFKDATFGVEPEDVASAESPIEGLTILRDRQWGVPHIYGETRYATMYGAGWANAADRLFLMDVLRHTGRASLSSFAGGSDSNRAMDRAQWRFAPYTDEELQQQIDQAPEFYGKEGQAVVDDAEAYVDGINAYIDAALTDPTLLPAEYPALGKLPEQWTTADLAAEASLIGGIFGKGGGAEITSALAAQAFEERFGVERGRRIWADFRAKEEPEAPVTVHGKRFPYLTQDAFSKRGLAMPDPGSVTDVPVVGGVAARPAPSSAAPTTRSEIGLQIDALADELRRMIEDGGIASNWEMISGEHSATGHPIGVLGPQVGYYLPQILLEIDIHGPGIDARGGAFPGVGLYVLLGHGRDYAWSATTAYADNVDTFAEVLCEDDVHYRYRGKCLPMDVLERTNSWTPSAGETSGPGSETLTAYRTVHGIVVSRATVGGKKVAYVISRSTYMHEPDSALFFRRMNNPDQMTGPKAFRKAVSKINFLFNWAYIDDEHIAYEMSGWLPDRAHGTSPDFPILGTGEYDWKGYDPERHVADWLPQRKHPHDLDPDYLVSWNNKQARAFGAADDKYAFGSVYRSAMIEDGVRALVRRSAQGGRKATISELVKAMELPATQDVRGVYVLPWMLRALGRPKDADLAKAAATLRAWHRDGSHRRDLDGDGVYDDDAAVTLMDAWWPLALEAEFGPSLGKETYAALMAMVDDGGPGRGEPDAPSFSDGWYGYVHKDLRSLYAPRTVSGRWTTVHCGGGSRGRCRSALQASLREALGVSKDDLYAFGDCAEDAQASCWDANRSISASAAGIPAQPFQNRPTFQQTVSIQRSVRAP